MPDGSIDPGALEGDALTSWYLRSPAEIEEERQAAAAKRYQDFFYAPSGPDPDPGFARQTSSADRDMGSDIAVSLSSQDVDPGFTWTQVGQNRFRSVKNTPDDGSSPGSTSYSDPPPASQPDAIGPYPEVGGSDVSASEPNLTPQPVEQPVGELRGPPVVAFGPPRSAAAQAGPQASAYRRLARPPASPVGAAVANPGHQLTPASLPRAGQTIAYGALRAPAPSDPELAELRRQQAAFANTTRQIDIHNSWFAVPALAPAVVGLGLGAAGESATGEVAPAAGRAVANFVERDPYLRVGDNWATRAGRRAHAWLEQQLEGKPGWDYEPDVARPGARPLKPDVGTPQRNPTDLSERYYLELKPNTPTGRAAAARAAKRYFDATQRKVRPIYYDPKDFI